MDYSEILTLVNKYYDIIDSHKTISENDKIMLQQEMQKIRFLINDESIQKSYELIFHLKKVVAFFSGLALWSGGLPLLLVLIYLIMLLNWVKKDEAETLQVDVEDENMQNKINNIIDNIDRMLEKKSQNIEEVVEESNTLDDYAEYVLEEFLKTGKVLNFLDQDLNMAVKLHLIFILENEFGIHDTKNVYQMLCIAKEKLEAEPNYALTRKINKK